jgi:hypothetical protein
MTIIKKLTITTDDEREQWVKLLKLASDYHYDMAGQFTPDIIGDTDMEEVSKVHRAWGRAIQEASELITLWEFEAEDDIRTPPAKNISPEWEDGRRWADGN